MLVTGIKSVLIYSNSAIMAGHFPKQDKGDYRRETTKVLMHNHNNDLLKRIINRAAFGGR